MTRTGVSQGSRWIHYHEINLADLALTIHTSCGYRTPMLRKQFFLTKPQVDNLEREAAKRGCSTVEVLRRIIDEYYDRQKQPKKGRP